MSTELLGQAVQTMRRPAHQSAAVGSCAGLITVTSLIIIVRPFRIIEPGTTTQ